MLRKLMFWSCSVKNVLFLFTALPYDYDRRWCLYFLWYALKNVVIAYRCYFQISNFCNESIFPVFGFPNTYRKPIFSAVTGFYVNIIKKTSTISYCIIKKSFAINLINSERALTHFRPMLHFYTLWKRQKTRSFLTFSESIERGHWPEIGWFAILRYFRGIFKVI